MIVSDTYKLEGSRLYIHNDKKMEHVALIVSDMDRSITFYKADEALYQPKVLGCNCVDYLESDILTIKGCFV
jgi:hypothetical protein